MTADKEMPGWREMTDDQREVARESLKGRLAALGRMQGVEVVIYAPPRCEHVWDGTACEPGGPGSNAVTCSKCGLDAMTHSLREGI